MLMLPVDPKRSGDERYTLADLGAVDTMVDNGWLGGNSMGEIMETYLDRVSGENPFEFYGTQFPVMVKTIRTAETTPVRVNGNSGNPGNSAPQTVTTNSRTVNGSSPAQGGGTVTYSKAHDVKTGDETHAEFWILLAVVAVTAGGAVLVRRKKT